MVSKYIGETAKNLDYGFGLSNTYFSPFAILRCAVTVGTMPLASVFSSALSPDAA